jgi:Uri superfamily endonuclease
MAWALQFDGVNDYASRDTADLFHQNLTQYAIKARLKETSSGSNYLIGQLASFNGYVTIRNDGTVRVKYGSTTVSFSFTRPTINTYYDFEVQRDGNTHRLYINEILQDTKSSSATNSSTNLGVIGRSSGSVSGFELEYLELYDAPTSGSLLYNYSATASSHAAGTPVLTDTVGGNNATGVNMPTDGSAWIDLGGSGTSIAVDSGSYSYAGTDAQLIASRVLKADAGSYLYTGSAVSLLKGFVLTASAGPYSYLGQDATLTYTPAGAFILTANSGNYVYTGSNINFNS